MGYLGALYERTMREAYGRAHREIAEGLTPQSKVLECGAGHGGRFDGLALGIPPEQYCGVEWSPDLVNQAKARGLDVREGDLNRSLPFDDDSFDCVFALSVLEHLLNGCAFLMETKRVLRPGGKLVLLTPNIATYFTAALLLLGRMPSTGPHPDSDALIRSSIDLGVKAGERSVEGDTPEHRHLVVFSFTALRQFLRIAGFESVKGRGFGLYPFPSFVQPALERVDPLHCHQMVFTARKKRF